MVVIKEHEPTQDIRRMGQQHRVTKELQSLIKQKMMDEPHRSYSELARILGISTSTLQYWAANDPQVQKVRQDCSNNAQKQLGEELKALLNNHRTFAEAKNIIRKRAKDDDQPLPGRIKLISALKSVMGDKQAMKLIETRNEERRDSRIEAVKAWVDGMSFKEVCGHYGIAKSTLYWRLEKMEKPKELQAKVNAKLPKILRKRGSNSETKKRNSPSTSVFTAGRSVLINQITSNFEGQAALVELARLRDNTHWYVPKNDLHLTAKHLTGGHDTFVPSVEEFIQTSDVNGKQAWIDVIWASGKKRKHPIAAFEIDISGERTNALTRFQDLVDANPSITIKLFIVVKPKHVDKTNSELERPCFENLDVKITTTDLILEALKMPYVEGWDINFLFDFLDVLKPNKRAE